MYIAAPTELLRGAVSFCRSRLHTGQTSFLVLSNQV